ncbi:MAG: hypothetical protein H5T86_12490 [Armatimonadetes bacterium]|nr:hypothetical protein [Armatimonadota bacterium]
MAGSTQERKISHMRTPTDPSTERAEKDVLDPSDPDAQREALAEIAELIHARRLTPIALFVLEAMRPLSFLTAEFLVFLEPFARIFLPPAKYRLAVEALHHRDNVDWLIDRLERLMDRHDTGGEAAREAATRKVPGDAAGCESSASACRSEGMLEQSERGMGRDRREKAD